MTEERDFSKLMESMLNQRLQAFVGRSSTRATMMEIYATVFNLIADIFAQSGIEISNEAANCVAQMYYEDLRLNGRNEVDDTIYTQRAHIADVPNHELVIMAKLWRKHPYGHLFAQALKDRS